MAIFIFVLIHRPFAQPRQSLLALRILKFLLSEVAGKKSEHDMRSATSAPISTNY